MPGYDYATYVSAIASIVESPLGPAPASAAPFIDSNYNVWLPRAIEQAEQRIYRELDLLFTRYSDTSKTVQANSRKLTLPNAGGQFIVVEQINVLPNSGNPSQLLPVSKQYLDFTYPSDAPVGTPSVPFMFAPWDQLSVYIAPSPDQNYPVEVIGTIRPAPLSSTNVTTVLTTYLPDLFIAASMISWMGMQRDFGQQDDDPKMALSWEAVYQTELKSAGLEEVRKKMQAQGWSSKLPSPIATPQQT